MSSIGSITYECAQYLANILSPLVGKTRYNIGKSAEFTNKVKNLKVKPDNELRSYDVSALFTSVSVDKALVIIRHKLDEYTTLSEITPLSPHDIVRRWNYVLSARILFPKTSFICKYMVQPWDHQWPPLHVIFTWRISNKRH